MTRRVTCAIVVILGTIVLADPGAQGDRVAAPPLPGEGVINGQVVRVCGQNVVGQ